MKQILYRLFEHQYLGREEARNILQNIAEGRYNDSQIASLITVFLMRSISVEELTGFREALLEMRVPVDLSEYRYRRYRRRREKHVQHQYLFLFRSGRCRLQCRKAR